MFAHNGRGDYEFNKSEKSDLRQRKLSRSRPRPQLMRLLAQHKDFSVESSPYQIHKLHPNLSKNLG